MGDKYLRRLLVVGMTSLVRRAKYKPEAVDPWLADLLVAQAVRVCNRRASPTRRHGSSGRSWCAAGLIVPATSRHWPS